MADDEPRQSSASRLAHPRAPTALKASVPRASPADPMETAVEYVMLAQGPETGPVIAAKMRTKLIKLNILTGDVRKTNELLAKARKTYRLMVGDTRPGQP